MPPASTDLADAMTDRPPPLPQDGIFRSILLVLVISVVLGAAVALVGELVYHDEAISRAGAWLAVLSGVVYLFFRILGRREARRQARRQSDRRRDQAWNDFDERDE